MIVAPPARTAGVPAPPGTLGTELRSSVCGEMAGNPPAGHQHRVIVGGQPRPRLPTGRSAGAIDKFGQNLHKLLVVKLEVLLAVNTGVRFESQPNISARNCWVNTEEQIVDRPGREYVKFSDNVAEANSGCGTS